AAVSQLTPAELRDAASEPVPAPDPDAPAPVLILTTGTTGAPKGARHDWRRLLAGVHVPAGVDAPRWLLACNLNQFAGIQVLLHALASAGSLVVPASRRPADVAAAIAEHGVTHASGTPTFWRLLSRELDPQSAAQLPLAQITLGGEAASDQLLSALRELFPQARISHVYAGTEVGSVVSVSDGRAGLPVSLLEGDGSAHASFKIVDGELHVRSDVGMLGYQAGADDAAGWRATGDQVEVRDGRIQFVGRSSEIINVGGAKVHPLPVEQLIGSVPGVQIAAVYGRPSPITGQIVSADVVAAPGHDVQALEAEIRQACEALPAAGRPRRIRFVDQVQTRGHKVVRQ
ncbi:MAG: long-chain fatty acid--CoA ligase, partial [Solirubrobacterales bacterium]|nr:long-chain fatty acid--CoA ligase [Solirubrobacterales bacterium]